MALFFILCGPTGCEKTTWIVELLKHHEELCSHTPKKLIWIYGVEEPDLFETIRKIWFPRQCEFINGFPEDLLTRLEQTSDRGSLCIFDNVMNEVSSNSMVAKLFTRGRSHLGCSLVLMLQNVFPKSTQSRTISINVQYQVLFSFLGISCSRTFGFWHEYLEITFTLSDFIEAERESNWLVHLETFKALLPYDKSFDHYKYLSWGLVYLIDMLKLPEVYPHVFEHFMDGKHTVSR